VICVDASLAAKWILEEEFSDKAEALLIACTQTGERIIAPPLLPIEVTNILRQRMRTPHAPLSLQDATVLLQRFLALPVELVSPEQLYETALALADAYNLPAAYDAHYAALAQTYGCNLWTNDQRLLRMLGGQLPFVKAIEDYAEGDPL
jgi:predicted nucleic acid-binding protein